MTAGPAAPEERREAFDLAFRHLSRADRAEKWANGRALIASGELPGDGILVARDRRGLAAAMIAAPLGGGGAAVWPPQARPGIVNPDAAVDCVLRQFPVWCGDRDIRIAQVLLDPEHTGIAAPLLRHGFIHVTRMIYLRHYLDLNVADFAAPRLTLRTFAEAGVSAFAHVLTATYVDSLDCPELNGLRTPAEVILGHRTETFDPSRWWLAAAGGETAGVLLMNAVPELDGWDVAYLGVVPQWRGRGFGRELLTHGLIEAKAAGALLVSLGVDARNAPARAMYRKAGFMEAEEREYYLCARQ